MSTIVYKTNKKTGVKYAYYSESHRDPSTKQPKSKRIYLGRVDPETGKVIPKAEKGKRNRSPVGTRQSDTPEVLTRDIFTVMDQQNEEIRTLNDELDSLRKKDQERKEKLIQIRNLLDEMIGQDE